jgi:hypothetical protein
MVRSMSRSKRGYGVQQVTPYRTFQRKGGQGIALDVGAT